MSDFAIKRVLIAVYDKTGIADFAQTLVEEFGVEILSTGGTAKHLKDAGVRVTMVEEVTGFPEMLDGRVKTLHPMIHAGILADRDNPEHMRQLEAHGIKPIDMVVVNLYPFEETISKPDCVFEDAIEMIDIGGPCMLRAAAKNHKHVLVVSSSADQASVLHALRDSADELPAIRRGLAERTFARTRSYDRSINRYFAERLAESEVSSEAGPDVNLRGLMGTGVEEYVNLRLRSKPRYGENPHQEARVYEVDEAPDCWQLEAVDSGSDSQPDMSFNNYADGNAALDLCRELSFAGRSAEEGTISSVRTCCFIKHMNARGVGVSGDPVEAYRRAYLGDPNAAMGGILSVDFPVDAAFAEVVMGSLKQWGKAAGANAFFVEVWIAPSFDDAAVEVIRTKKKWGQRVRLLSAGDMAAARDAGEMDYKKIVGGMLVQQRDLLGLNEEQWRIATDRRPSDGEMADLRLAWLVCKHTKSNAITLCKDGMLIGNGAGQMSRIMSCRIATWLAKENGHEAKLQGSAAASDAFFPFRDGPDILADAGVTAIIQPGGSKRDEETIAACNERGIAMVFTGTRHFKH